MFKLFFFSFFPSKAMLSVHILEQFSFSSIFMKLLFCVSLSLFLKKVKKKGHSRPFSSNAFFSNFKSTSLALNRFKDKIVFFILNHQWRCCGGINFSVARYRRLAMGKLEKLFIVLNIYDCFILTQKSIAKMLLWGIYLSSCQWI